MDEIKLYKKLEVLKESNNLSELPEIIKSGLSDNITLREYQIDAFRYFITYFENNNLRKNKKIHNLFHMATGSGKTVIMAGLILYLYTKGYRNFLFFVNQTNILEKTKDNFINNLSSKYLFNENIEYLGQKVKIKIVDSFQSIDDSSINICFTTTQKLHSDLWSSKENSLSYFDFETQKTVLISDESHHINATTKKLKPKEIEEQKTWEESVQTVYNAKVDNILLEFTATCDTNNFNILRKYYDKIIFDYPLIKFRESGYTKDFVNLSSDTDLWDRTLIALTISEYRRYLFSDLKLNIKPVILMKSQKIKESQNFYNIFYSKLKTLSPDSFEELFKINSHFLQSALTYFKEKDESFSLLTNSIKDSFSENKAIIINGTSDDNKSKQLLLNSLEDQENPYRIIFSVDMLNEGWDVLNLFDIVRLYDTRQGSGRAGKVGAYTMREAQLIGRGARYCPFIYDSDESKYVRKFDFDINNELRILETMLYHSKNDSRYITELKQALIATGLQPEEPIKVEYKLKDSFKNTDLYENGLVYSNKKVKKGRSYVNGIEGSYKTKTYTHRVHTKNIRLTNLIGNDEFFNLEETSTQGNSIVKKIKEIELNIVLGASERFEALRFNYIKRKYPHLTSFTEFITSDNYLGNINLEIIYPDNYEIKAFDWYSVCLKMFKDIAMHVASIKMDYEGSKEFTPHLLKDVIKDKTMNLSKIESNVGLGVSQSRLQDDKYGLNLANEDWFVYTDNYGTSEEKLFVKFFKSVIIPKLEKKNLEYYLIRNERIPQLAIYSFENGERFEPDFLLIVTDKNNTNSHRHQIYVEPKGSHLLLNDKWKEDFLKEIENKSIVKEGIRFGYDYKIIGLPFFNEEEKKQEVEKSIDFFLSEL